MSEEHRKENRKRLMAFSPVFDATINQLLGYVEDLTLQGVMVIGEKEIETGHERLLRIEFPSEDTAHILIPARSAWCRQDINVEYYNTGFEFLRIAPEQAAILEVILDKYHFHQEFSASDYLESIRQLVYNRK